MAIDRVRVNERSNKVIEFDVVDQESAAVPASVMQTATITLVNLDTYEPGASPAQGIINFRDAQDILNNNDVSIDSSGHVIWTMQVEDNPIVTPRRQIERHRAMFHFAWSLGEFRFQCEIEVVNLLGAS